MQVTTIPIAAHNKTPSIIPAGPSAPTINSPIHFQLRNPGFLNLIIESRLGFSSMTEIPLYNKVVIKRISANDKTVKAIKYDEYGISCWFMDIMKKDIIKSAVYINASTITCTGEVGWSLWACASIGMEVFILKRLTESWSKYTINV